MLFHDKVIEKSHHQVEPMFEAVTTPALFEQLTFRKQILG